MHDDDLNELNEDTESDLESPPEAAPSAHYVEPTVELTSIEARVLGALIEKSYTTPDAYPMTTNSLVTACNQKTSRDPVVSYDAIQVDTTLMELRQRKLVRRVHTQGARSTKHKHTLDEVLPLDPRQIVLLSVLLLRGDQTAGELRGRSERHDVFSDVAELHGTEVHECLKSLAARDVSLVVELARQPGHKETRWRHLLGDGSHDEPLAAVEDTPASDSPSPAVVAASPVSSESPVAPASAPPAPAPTSAPQSSGPRPSFADRVDTLEAEVASLKAKLEALADSLGEELT